MLQTIVSGLKVATIMFLGSVGAGILFGRIEGVFGGFLIISACLLFWKWMLLK